MPNMCSHTEGVRRDDTGMERDEKRNRAVEGGDDEGNGRGETTTAGYEDITGGCKD
jgi:hypothetical protein